jgi:hypothetical protein
MTPAPPTNYTNWQAQGSNRMPKARQRTTDTATSAAAHAAEVSDNRMPTGNTPLADASAIAPTFNLPALLAPAADAALALRKIDAALPQLAGTAAYDALLPLRDAAFNVLVEAEAAAVADAARMAEIELVTAASAALPAGMLDIMLAAIDSKYAEVAVEAEALPAAAPTAPTSGRRQPGANTLARTAAVTEALATDASVASRTDATIAAYYRTDHRYLDNVHPAAGTRFASIVALASESAGVANFADFGLLVTAVRLRLALPPYSLKTGGQSVADFIWTTGTGAHAADGPKGSDTLRLKFSDRRALAQYPDGRFRLAAPNTPNVRFVHIDAAALAAFKGSGAAAATTAPEAPVTPASAPTAPRTAPTPPSTLALPDGSLTPTVHCRHCGVRNLADAAKCKACSESDFKA